MRSGELLFVTESLQSVDLIYCRPVRKILSATFCAEDFYDCGIPVFPPSGKHFSNMLWPGTH